MSTVSLTAARRCGAKHFFKMIQLILQVKWATIEKLKIISGEWVNKREDTPISLVCFPPFNVPYRFISLF